MTQFAPGEVWATNVAVAPRRAGEVTETMPRDVPVGAGALVVVALGGTAVGIAVGGMGVAGMGVGGTAVGGGGAVACPGTAVEMASVVLTGADVAVATAAVFVGEGVIAAAGLQPASRDREINTRTISFITYSFCAKGLEPGLYCPMTLLVIWVRSF